MKNLDELLELSYKGRTVPVARNEFVQRQDPPFIVYISEAPTISGADNIVYYQKNRFRVELYTTRKEGALEEMMEERFTDRGLYYEKDGDIKIETENLWLTTYYL